MWLVPYAHAPWQGSVIGVSVAWVLFGDTPSASFIAALALMALGSWLSLPGEDSAA